MRIYDLIAKKRDGGTHSREELEAIVNGFVSGEVADYQMAAWMMAVYLRGMTDEETAELTDVMAHSGVMVDLSPIPGIKVDKHSTGGVGDKTTLVIAPIVAACGVKIAKMSGRGLGHTGGTIDKMESVPGTKTALSQEEFFAQVNKIGLSVIGQSEGIAVADKKMYALRDVTATVSCIPLIASSIMSKKLASGSDAILLDVTTGTGAFMKTVDQSIELAKLMVSIGTHHGRRVAAMITDMDTPLGHNIGNSLEVMESMDVLKGHGPADLTEVCLQLAANMLVLADKGSPAECRAMAEAVIADGSAYAKCKEMFAAQGGDTRVLDDYSLFEKPAASYELLAEEDGYIVANDAEKIGSASVLLGAGRQKKGDPLDFAAGITLHKKRGDYVHKGESLATFYGAADKFDAAAAEYRSGLVYQKARGSPAGLRPRHQGRRGTVLRSPEITQKGPAGFFMSCGAFAVCGALEGHCEVFCGSFDVDGLVDELPVCGGVGGCQLIAAALCFEGEAAVLVGGGLRHDLAFTQERDLRARHGGLVSQHDAALDVNGGHQNDACRDGRSRAHADEDSGTTAATATAATAARGRAAAGGGGRSRVGGVVLIFGSDTHRLFIHRKGCSRSSGVIQRNITFIDNPAVELVRGVSHNGNLIALLGGVRGQRLGKSVIVDLDDSTAGDGNGKFGGFNRVRSFDVRRIAVAVIFVDDGNIVCASRDSTLADNIVFTVTTHIFGGILGVGNAVTVQMEALVVHACMELSSSGGINNPTMPRPVGADAVLGEQ